MDRGNRLGLTVKINRHYLHPRLPPLRGSRLVGEHNGANAPQRQIGPGASVSRLTRPVAGDLPARV
jgi:hypothetical protein